MGLGMPSGLANRLGNMPTAITCTGTTSGTAAPITQKVFQLTAAASQTGAILPAAASLGSSWIGNCVSSTSAVVYPPAGATINGAASLTLAQNKTAVFTVFSTTVWFANLSA